MNKFGLNELKRVHNPTGQLVNRGKHKMLNSTMVDIERMRYF